MRNAVVIGCGRSGTSLLAGILHHNGWFLGPDLYIEPSESNPKGFFEDRDVNSINEELLATLETDDHWMDPGQRWLASVPLDTGFAPAPWNRAGMARLTARAPWCLKDPRFCYTLPAWREQLGNAVHLCVFRDPARTARSILRECQTQEYLATLRVDFASAVGVWTQMYRHVLDRHRHAGQWAFVHYDQCLDGSALPHLSDVVGAKLEPGFSDPLLNRSVSQGDVGWEASEIYRHLCELAGYGSQALALAG